MSDDVFMEGFDSVDSNSSHESSSNNYNEFDRDFLSGFSEGMDDQRSSSNESQEDVGKAFLESLSTEHGFQNVEDFISDFNRTKAEMEQQDAHAEYSALVENVMDTMGYYDEQDAINYIEGVLRQDEFEQYQQQQANISELGRLEEYYNQKHSHNGDFDSYVRNLPPEIFEIMEQNPDISLTTAHEIYDIVQEDLYDQEFLEGFQSV